MLIKFLLLLFLVFLFVIFAFSFSVIRFIFRLFFGGRNTGKQQASRERQNKTHYAGTKNTPKVFSKDEGEYIDYEDV